MNETRIYADAFETTFANTKEMLEFLAERAKASRWIRKPTRMLRLVPLEKEAETIEKACTKQLEGIVEDTEKNTQLVLKINGEVYPVRDCAMHTILKRAGVSGTGLRKLEKATYAKVINYCLKVARGDALIKIADGKVSAVHGGDEHDYCVLDMEAVFSMTCDYLKAHFSGSAYLEGSGTYDHSIAWDICGWEVCRSEKKNSSFHQSHLFLLGTGVMDGSHREQHRCIVDDRECSCHLVCAGLWCVCVWMRSAFCKDCPEKIGLIFRPVL